MTTTRLTRQTVQDLKELETVHEQKKKLEEQEEALKWRILDRREAGSQTAVAKVFDVSRSAVGQWIAAREAASTVAHRSLESSRLFCVPCAPPKGDTLEPLTADDLPEGGVCSECGTDVLA
ncbi:hypothetical protein [Streptomyces nanshensis]|uniref:Uncharacterized protein n=1 Tax=Streptomyces nanshensis TaxID=518642 RepID=A0A1E7LB50_9ACTN|nr:hypothetical protein [Streptomyces nanshensis]OEV13203.1 hypothetical protein AN218_04615 [Streptomyces nanshensis]